MGVKVIEIYPGKWYVRVVHNHFRKTKHIGSKERAMEVGRKLTTALELYGFDALNMFEDSATEPATKPAVFIPTVKEYHRKWLAEIEKTDVKRSTKELYSYLMSKHNVPAFGKERIDAIDYPKLKAWVIKQSGKYARDTVRLMVSTLRVMLQEAVNEGILLVNPVMKLGKFYRSAKKVKEKIDPFTIEELHQVESKCREKFPERYPFILCMARTGMRIGEATAIQWYDIDFAKNYILIRRHIPHQRHVETTKTQASQHTVDMSPELAAELKRLQMERKKQALADGKAFDMEAWVFPNEDGSPIHYTNFLRRVWHKVQDQAKVRRRTPHDMRHTWASHMLAAGADLAYVSNQMGHANP
ncbi:MAG: site-specific integrase [Acidobacteriota bacterium]